MQFGQYMELLKRDVIDRPITAGGGGRGNIIILHAMIDGVKWGYGKIME